MTGSYEKPSKQNGVSRAECVHVRVCVGGQGAKRRQGGGRQDLRIPKFLMLPPLTDHSFASKLPKENKTLQTATQLKLLQFAGMETAESFASDSLVPAGHDTQGAHDVSYLVLPLLPSEEGSMDFLLSKAEPQIYSRCFSFFSEQKMSTMLSPVNFTLV